MVLRTSFLLLGGGLQPLWIQAWRHTPRFFWSVQWAWDEITEAVESRGRAELKRIPGPGMRMDPVHVAMCQGLLDDVQALVDRRGGTTVSASAPEGLTEALRKLHVCWQGLARMEISFLVGQVKPDVGDGTQTE